MIPIYRLKDRAQFFERLERRRMLTSGEIQKTVRRIVTQVRTPVADTRSPLGSQTLADTTIRYVHDKQWEFAASIRNLFDEDAREYTSTKSLAEYLPLPGRNFYAEIRYKF